MTKTDCGSPGLAWALPWLALGLWLIAGPAQAETIPTLFNTGVDTGGVALASQYDNAHGIADPHYSLASVPSGGTTQMEVYNYDQWLAPGANSSWITPHGYSNGYGTINTGPPGIYDYQTTFDLTGFDPRTASITGGWSADNQGLDILINGFSTSPQLNRDRFQSLTGFSINSHFLPGINTLTFRVENFPGPPEYYNNPTGLRVEFTTATATPMPGSVTTPEPAAALIWGTMLLALSGCTYRRNAAAGRA